MRGDVRVSVFYHSLNRAVPLPRFTSITTRVFCLQVKKAIRRHDKLPTDKLGTINARPLSVRSRQQLAFVTHVGSSTNAAHSMPPSAVTSNTVFTTPKIGESHHCAERRNAGAVGRFNLPSTGGSRNSHQWGDPS
jgi:hypothetical protein